MEREDERVRAEKWQGAVCPRAQILDLGFSDVHTTTAEKWIRERDVVEKWRTRMEKWEKITNWHKTQSGSKNNNSCSRDCNCWRWWCCYGYRCSSLCFFFGTFLTTVTVVQVIFMEDVCSRCDSGSHWMLLLLWLPPLMWHAVVGGLCFLCRCLGCLYLLFSLEQLLS